MPIPKKTDFIAFGTDKFKMKEFVPYIIYADFESGLKPVRDEVRHTVNTVKKTHHTPTSFSYYIVSRNPEDKREYIPYLYRGPEAPKVFWRRIKHEIDLISRILEDKKPIIISDEERESLCNTPNPICHICEERILDSKELVLDHDHLSTNLRQPNDPRGPCNVRGVAHNQCNLAYTVSSMVPVVLQNGSKYDFRFIVSECVDEEDVKKKHN